MGPFLGPERKSALERCPKPVLRVTGPHLLDTHLWGPGVFLTYRLTKDASCGTRRSQGLNYSCLQAKLTGCPGRSSLMRGAGLGKESGVGCVGWEGWDRTPDRLVQLPLLGPRESRPREAE